LYYYNCNSHKITPTQRRLTRNIFGTAKLVVISNLNINDYYDLILYKL